MVLQQLMSKNVINAEISRSCYDAHVSFSVNEKFFGTQAKVACVEHCNAGQFCFNTGHSHSVVLVFLRSNKGQSGLRRCE